MISQFGAIKIKQLSPWKPCRLQLTCGIYAKIFSTFPTSKPSIIGGERVQTSKVIGRIMKVNLFYFSLMCLFFYNSFFPLCRYHKFYKRCLNERKKLGIGCSEVHIMILLYQFIERMYPFVRFCLLIFYLFIYFFSV